MRIAYLLMVHRQPEQVRALLRALPPESPVFVHIDRRVRRRMYLELVALREERPFTLVRRHRCYWGRIGMVRATLELARAALLQADDWEYASLLSGADYPIASNSRIAEVLEQRRGAQFISAWDMRAENPWKHAPGRMQSDSRVDHQHFGAGRHIWTAPWRRAVPYGLHPFGGSQWWTLSQDAVRHVIDYTVSHPKLLRFMRGVFVPDECVVQTVLANSEFREAMADDDLRHVVWDRPEGPWPALLDEGDVERMGSSGKLYARKFDLSRTPDVFDAVDAALRQERTSAS